MNPINKQQFLNSALNLQPDLISHRRALHQMPEIGMNLPKTRQYVKKHLEALGYDTQVIGEGLVATISGNGYGPTILLRADMDALPITEETDLTFKSQNDAMHACGHDMHTAMLLGAAHLLKENKAQLHGTVKLMFQPAEETLEGAKAMLEAGVLENPTVDAALMIHVFTGFPIPAGLVIVPNPGTSTAASDHFSIEIQGKGGHGAMPNTTVDPLNVAAHTHIALQSILSREIDPTDPAVVTIGKIEGGHAHNIIPDRVSLSGTIRSYSPETHEFIKKRVIDIATMTAQSFRATAEVHYPKGCPSVVNDKTLVQHAQTALPDLLGLNRLLAVNTLLPNGGKLPGSEDFSFVSSKCPSLMLALTAGNAQEGYAYPQHHPKAIFDESVLAIGAATYAYYALSWLAK